MGMEHHVRKPIHNEETADRDEDKRDRRQKRCYLVARGIRERKPRVRAK